MTRCHAHPPQGPARSHAADSQRPTAHRPWRRHLPPGRRHRPRAARPGPRGRGRHRQRRVRGLGGGRRPPRRPFSRGDVPRPPHRDRPRSLPPLHRAGRLDRPCGADPPGRLPAAPRGRPDPAAGDRSRPYGGRAHPVRAGLRPSTGRPVDRGRVPPLRAPVRRQHLHLLRGVLRTRAVGPRPFPGRGQPGRVAYRAELVRDGRRSAGHRRPAPRRGSAAGVPRAAAARPGPARRPRPADRPGRLGHPRRDLAVAR